MLHNYFKIIYQIDKHISTMISLDEAKIKEIASDKEQPLVIRLIIKDLVNAELSLKVIMDARNYVFGAAAQEVKQEITIKEQPLFPDLKNVIRQNNSDRENIES